MDGNMIKTDSSASPPMPAAVAADMPLPGLALGLND